MLKLRFKNNKHNAVWLVEPKVVVGRSAECDLVLTDAGVLDKHIEIQVEHESVRLQALTETKVLLLNGQPVVDTDVHALKVNDTLNLAGVELEIIDPKIERKPAPTVPRQVETTGWALKANHTALANRVFALKSEMVVGRSNECDITLAAAHLSRRHAKLLIKNGLLYVKDLGSSNGTYINGKRVAEARVKRGDELRFDTLSFGVIGPADDMDKTTVRSAPSQTSSPKQAAKVKTVKQPSPKPAKPVAVETIAPTPVAESSSKGGLIFMALLVVAGIGGYVAKTQGLF